LYSLIWVLASGALDYLYAPIDNREYIREFGHTEATAGRKSRSSDAWVQRLPSQRIALPAVIKQAINSPDGAFFAIKASPSATTAIERSTPTHDT
jgi:hypothetical protein